MLNKKNVCQCFFKKASFLLVSLYTYGYAYQLILNIQGLNQKTKFKMKVKLPTLSKTDRAKRTGSLLSFNIGYNFW